MLRLAGNSPVRGGGRQWRAALLSLVAGTLPFVTVPVKAGPADPGRIEAAPPAADAYSLRSRLFVLTDVGNEPDDQMSFVRLLLYANDIDIEGLAATTSIHLPAETHPETLLSIIDAYDQVRPMLLRNAPNWPTAAALRARVSSGPSAYGLAAMDPDRPSPATLALIAAADRADPRPLWVAVWGGANVLAEALSHVRATRQPAAVAAFVAKLRVYAISDQDDAGPRIRHDFPALRYVVSPSSADVLDYGSATWSGIAGDRFYLNCDGAETVLVDEAWLQKNIRIGPLGSRYPGAAAIMEGDTPSFLDLIPNGLDAGMNPGWGGWGGRYVWRGHPLAGGPIWTQGGFPIEGLDSRDMVTGVDGRAHRSDQATIWRWRRAFQNDFAARIAWTVKPFADANHPPIPVVNGSPGLAPIVVSVPAGGSITLDASASHDDDQGQALAFHWFLYPEAGSFYGRRPPDLRLSGADQARARIENPCASGCTPGEMHLVLQVTDNGTPALARYRRVILRTGN